MPANLTADFIKARQKLRDAKTPEEKLAALEEMLSTIPKHKGTDHMQADIKKRIAKARGAAGQSKKGKSSSYEHIPKDGAGQVVLVGPPNVGKSSLLDALTNANPEVAAYPFSTHIPVPGMMTYEDIRIQLIDLPPLAPDYTESWVYSLIRSSDLVLIALDATDGALLKDEFDELIEQLEERNIQLVSDRRPETDNRMREVPARIILTKSDLADAESIGDAVESLPFSALSVSAVTGAGLDALRASMFDALDVIRVYTKLPGQKADMTEPYTLPIGSQAIDAVKAVHREFADRLKYVRIWGSGRFDGQQVPADHELHDGDIVEVHLRKLASGS
ncbi:50S ribosome-binding GTPase [Candidatus Bipolaricaulota bacterium]|nr:50S ribosome-binding GTPase [Candidatus Bipolaricaulota bacterium]TFH10361.1 MAG: TGS domain-containing protein [Candidatus Atribacteria bacterium]